MSTPGSGNQPPQDPAQGWGQQPPAGQPGPGQQPPAGQQPPSGQQFGAPQGQPQQFGQPGQPQGQPWGAPGSQPQQPPKKSGVAKMLPIIGGVLALVIVAVLAFSFFGGGAPEVGDCVKTSDSEGYEVVDCDSDEAEYRVFGTDDDMTESEFYADADTCQDAATEANITDGVSLWYGNTGDEGQVFCAETL